MMRRLCWLLVGAVSVGCSSDNESTKPTTDARAEALTYAKDNLPCTTVADCCVVFDGCRAQGLVVASQDKDKVAALLKSAPNDMCVNCIAPAAQVKCVSGMCTGVEMNPGADMSAGEPARRDHCGAVTLPADWTEKTQSVEPTPAGLNPTKVLGCGT